MESSRSVSRSHRPPIAIDDAALVKAVAAGDAKVAVRLYDRLFGVVDVTLRRVFGRREADHEDLVQAAFEQIVLTLTRRRFAGACSLPSWASHVTTRVALKALRTRCRERGVFCLTENSGALVGTPAPGPNVEEEAGARIDVDRLGVCLGAMTAEKAEAVLLHDVAGYELAEIATLTGASEAAVQSRLVRGRKELVAMLGWMPLMARRLRSAKSFASHPPRAAQKSSEPSASTSVQTAPPCARRAASAK
jgi:RNA polymerase sigma-70 factor (ECF subfamily)